MHNYACSHPHISWIKLNPCLIERNDFESLDIIVDQRISTQSIHSSCTPSNWKIHVHAQHFHDKTWNFIKWKTVWCTLLCVFECLVITLWCEPLAKSKILLCFSIFLFASNKNVPLAAINIIFNKIKLHWLFFFFFSTMSL